MSNSVGYWWVIPLVSLGGEKNVLGFADFDHLNRWWNLVPPCMKSLLGLVQSLELKHSQSSDLILMMVV